MKKILALGMCAALAVSLAACGDSSSGTVTENEEVVTEEDVVEDEVVEEEVFEEEADAEEALSEELEEPEADITETEDAEAGYVTASYEGMTFSYPADCEYEEGDGYAMITLEEGKELIELVSLGEYEQEEGDTLSMGDVLVYMLMSFLTSYDDIQDESVFDLTVADSEAKGITALVSLNSSWYSFSGVAVYDEEEHIIYEIIYNYAYGAEGRLSDYEAILDSITFDGGGTYEGANTAGVDEDNRLTEEAAAEGKTFSQDQLGITAIPTEDGLVAVFITNNSDEIVRELDVQINYKDESGTTIDIDSDGHDIVLPGSTVVSRMKAPDSYADFEIETDIDLEAHPKYENHAADVEINSNLGEDCIIIEITNNSDVTIEEIEYNVVLYKDGNIVTIMYPHDVRDVEPGQTVTEKENTYRNEFDDYEIYLNQAHIFNIGN